MRTALIMAGGTGGHVFPGLAHALGALALLAEQQPGGVGVRHHSHTFLD